MSKVKKEIPPGIRIHLEEREAHLRRLGIDQGVIDAMLEEMARIGRAEAILNQAMMTATLLVHQDDGWLARRRLRKTLVGSPDAVARHLGSCAACGAWLDAVRDAFIFDILAAITATAPK